VHDWLQKNIVEEKIELAGFETKEDGGGRTPRIALEQGGTT